MKFFAVDVVEFAKQGAVGRENNYEGFVSMSLIDDSICEVLVFTGLFQKYGTNSGGVTEQVAANEHALSLALLKSCFASEHV